MTTDYSEKSDDLRVLGIDPLIQPALLRAEIPLSPEAKQTIFKVRSAVAAVLAGTSDKIVVIVGPCSIHNVEEALEYAKLLKEAEKDVPELVLVMRTYFEKPRTTVGWKGLINDPEINGTYSINTGLRVARSLLADITHLGLGVGAELLDTISPQFLSDCLSYGALGARTIESQLHRELASGCSFAVGMKNGTDGSVSVAVDAMRSASQPHAFLGVTESGLAAIVKTKGNGDLHVILRGGTSGTNFDSVSVRAAAAAVQKASSAFLPAVMVDMSHANSSKDHRNQPIVCANICAQLAAGESAIMGVMIESNLEAGNQKTPNGKVGLLRGVSITDACVDWTTTVPMLKALNDAVIARRNLKLQA